MEAESDRGRSISLSGGETRLLHLQQHSVIIGIKGAVLLTEGPVYLGDSYFRIQLALSAGATHEVAYGGYISVQAQSSACLRCIPPRSVLQAWTARLAAAAAAVPRIFTGWRSRRAGV